MIAGTRNAIRRYITLVTWTWRCTWRPGEEIFNQHDIPGGGKVPASSGGYARHAPTANCRGSRICLDAE